MKLVITLIIGLMFFVSCSKQEGSYEPPQEPVRRLELLEAPPIQAQKEIKVEEMVDGGAGTYRLKEHKVFVTGRGSVTYIDALGNQISEDAWGSFIVPYEFEHKSKIVHGFDLSNVSSNRGSYTNNDLIVLSNYHEVPLFFSKAEGIYKNVVHFETQLTGSKDQLTVQPSFIREKSGSFMVNQVYNDPRLISLSNRFYKVDDTTFEKRFTMVRKQNDSVNAVHNIIVTTVHISTYELVNDDLIPFDKLAQEYAEDVVGPFFVDNKQFKLDYDFYNQAVIFFSTNVDGAALFETFKEAMLFANDIDGLALEGEESFLFAEDVISQETPGTYLALYKGLHNEAVNVLGMTKEEADLYIQENLAE